MKGSSLLELQVAVMLLSGALLGLGTSVVRASGYLELLLDRQRTEVRIGESGDRLVLTSIDRPNPPEALAKISILTLAGDDESGWQVLVQRSE